MSERENGRGSQRENGREDARVTDRGGDASVASAVSLLPDRRARSALLWGGVGFLAFLVLLQGYALYDEPLVSIARGGAIAVVVGLVTAVFAYALEYRLAAWATERE